MFSFDTECSEFARSANRIDTVHARRNWVFQELLENVLFGIIPSVITPHDRRNDAEDEIRIRENYLCSKW